MSQTPSHQRWDAWLTNCTPKDFHASVFFYTSGTPHARHIHTCFELWGRPFRSSLLASFFLLVLLWKEFIPLSFVVTFHLSRLFGSPPFFFLIQPGTVIRFKHRLFCLHIQQPLVVSLNNETWLAYQRQQSVGSISLQYSTVPDNSPHG